EPLAQGLERQLVALEEALEPLREHAQHPRGGVLAPRQLGARLRGHGSGLGCRDRGPIAGRRGGGGPRLAGFAHDRLPTPSSLGMWHFLYFLPLPHGHGSLRPTRGAPRTTGTAGAGAGAPRRGRSSASSAAGGRAPPKASASACWVLRMRGARGCCSIARTASGASCTRNRRCTKSSRTSFNRVVNSSYASFLYSIRGSRWP